jgi:hypothetical protein
MGEWISKASLLCSSSTPASDCRVYCSRHFCSAVHCSSALPPPPRRSNPTTPSLASPMMDILESIWISIGDSTRPARDGRCPQSRPRSLARTPTSASHFNERLDWHFDPPIELIIGAGVNGFGGIIRLGNLFVSGAAVVRFQNRSWGPSPVYEVVDFGFNRPITAGCIFCLADVRGR